MNASTLVICRDEIDPRRVRISGTNADHLVLFSDTIPLALLKEILARMEQDPEATVRLNPHSPDSVLNFGAACAIQI